MDVYMYIIMNMVQDNIISDQAINDIAWIVLL